MTLRTTQINLDDFRLWDEIVLGQDVLCPLRISIKRQHSEVQEASKDATYEQYVCRYRLIKANLIKKTEARTLLNTISGVSALRSFTRAGQLGLGAVSPSA